MKTAALITSAPPCLAQKSRRSLLLLAWLLSMLLGNQVFAQSTTAQDGIDQSTVYIKNGTAQALYNPGLSDEVFRKLLNRELSKILNPKATSVIGNFAAIDLKEASVSAAGTFNYKNGFLIAKASGGVSDGLLPIFTNTKLNTGIELSAQLNWFASNTAKLSRVQHKYPGNNAVLYDIQAFNMLQYTGESHDAYEKKMREIEAEYDLNIYKASNNVDGALLVLEKSKLQNQEKKTKEKISANNAKLDDEHLSRELVPLFTARKDSLEFELYRIQQSIGEISFKLSHPPLSEEQEFKAGNAAISSRRAAHNDIVVTGARISWFSLGYTVRHSAFRLLDASKVYEEQVSKETFIGHTLRFQYSRYMYTGDRNKSYFWTIGVAPSITDNLSDLTKKEVVEENPIGTASASNSRYSSEKYNAYQGAYKESRFAASIFGDYYKFVGKNNRFAIHLFPEHRIREDKLPTTNIGVGLLVAFQNAEKEKTVVNTEIYANATNVLNIGDPEGNALKRGTAGLRFTFPIAFR